MGPGKHLVYIGTGGALVQGVDGAARNLQQAARVSEYTTGCRRSKCTQTPTGCSSLAALGSQKIAVAKTCTATAQPLAHGPD
jgi:hypothetical protein